MARKGLGKGLDSLIPDFYNEDFDSNSPQSLEDMLKKNEPVEETEEEVIEEVKDDENVEDVNSDSTGSGEVQEEVPEEEESEEDEEDDSTSEDLPSDESVEDDVQTSQKIQVNQEHVDEVIEIVEKNPRITLWSSKSSAVFRYLRKTEPEFSISKEASVLIEEAVAKKYPEIWELFKDL
ncbi:MAG: AAA family ATPase [Methanobrevibacter sp.]|uniref:AAA family ATPase n=1 Tax=Methanobrevibacter sp. TaxID=66852 RepID=UPI001B04BFEB|nr:AAA family ATPase [Methanobrevibacter sp.]MBO6111346.1 AAA family ATPase [Methanobrevibacter sp.]MBP3792281.1 AAA family ATPase [Methanobrevibacter sp.]